MVRDAVVGIARRKSDLQLISNPLYWVRWGIGRNWSHCGQINMPIERVPIAEVVKEQIKLSVGQEEKAIVVTRREKALIGLLNDSTRARFLSSLFSGAMTFRAKAIESRITKIAHNY
jgi:hypothetical protein